MIKKLLLLVVIFFGLISFAQSETSWIKKKSNKVNSFCVKKSTKSSFGYPVIVLNNSSICGGKDVVVTMENNSELFKFLKVRNDQNNGAFFIKDNELSKHSSNNNKKLAKVEKKKTSNWIKKKKEVKKNKKKLKEKIKDSKSWITKKSKDKVKNIKEKLKKHKTIDQLPKAEFYFAAIIRPIEEDKETQYIYGYVKSNKKSELIESNGKSFYSLSDGIAYFENKKNRCEVDSLLTARRSGLSGDVIIKCKKNLKMTGGFVQVGSIGRGFGETSDGNLVEFEFFTSKKNAIAKLENYKNRNKKIQVADNTDLNEELNIKPHGKYYALLIGNSKYTDPSWVSLKSPVNDIKEISNILKKNYDFEKIITIPNAKRGQIFDAFDELIELTTDEDYVLIYYAGHGETKKNQAYWVPVNGTNKIRDWVNIRDISVYVETMNAKHLVLMVDSCYTGSAFKGTNKINNNENKDLKRLANKLLEGRARYVLSSGGNEPVIDSSGGKHSLFAKSFIRSLKENGLINMGKIAYNVLIAHSELNQRPYFYSPETWDHAGGDFIFIPKKQ